MGCSPSHEGLYGDIELNEATTKHGDLKQKSLNSVTFVEHDLVWSAGKKHKLIPSKLEQVNKAIKTLALTPTKFMQQVQNNYCCNLNYCLRNNIFRIFQNSPLTLSSCFSLLKKGDERKTKAGLIEGRNKYYGTCAGWDKRGSWRGFKQSRSQRY